MTNRFLRTFLPRLEQAGIQYAIVRGWEDIPNSMLGGDCDMWVDETQYEQLKQILRSTLTDCNGIVASYMEGYKELLTKSLLKQFGIVTKYAVVLHLAAHRIESMQDGCMGTLDRLAYLG